MKQEIKVPQAGESVTEAMISEWFVEDGTQVEVDQIILELETDKANMEMAAPAAGVLHIAVAAEEMVTVGQVIGYIDTVAAAASPGPSGEAASEPEPSVAEATESSAETAESPPLSPAVRRIVAEEKLDPNAIDGSGKDGRILKGDALAAAAQPAPSQPEPVAQRPDTPGTPLTKTAAPTAAPAEPKGARSERVVNMSMMRRSIAKRLVDAQHTAAILTTFNEIDMSAVMALRSQYKGAFEKQHGVRLGFMSFFIKASIAALQAVPEINAKIDGNKILYRDYCDIGVAVGTPKGLVVPVIRNAEQMSFAELEQAIYNYAIKARDGKISLDDLSGGTFTLSNGGVYGSLLSTPILNPPQSGILGMHKIEKRPVAINDEVVIRPMMYVALSYDHRIVDGKGAVTFLVKVKECMEDPARMLLEI